MWDVRHPKVVDKLTRNSCRENPGSFFMLRSVIADYGSAAAGVSLCRGVRAAGRSLFVPGVPEEEPTDPRDVLIRQQAEEIAALAGGQRVRSAWAVQGSRHGRQLKSPVAGRK